MPSTAIASQGTLVQVASGSGTAKTVTAAAAGVVTIFTATAHGFSKGDLVTLAGIGGATTLTGQFSVAAVTANTFAVNVDTTGATLTVTSATAAPATFATIGNIKSFQGIDGTANEIDVTNLLSAAKEVRLGLPDSGQFTIEVDQDSTDAGQIAVRVSCQAQTLKQYKITFAGGAVLTFSAYCKKFSTAAGIDQVVKGSIALRITGAYTLV
jgi:hypothetical protein